MSSPWEMEIRIPKALSSDLEDTQLLTGKFLTLFFTKSKSRFSVTLRLISFTAMNLSLNPKAFSGPLRFEWFVSDEGSTWELALQYLLARMEIEEFERLLVFNYVAETLTRIGRAKLRRHYEIRPISLGQDLSLVELRWTPAQLGQDVNLRMYAYVDYEKALLIGLCFRQKVIGVTHSDTTRLQNRDIQRAISLASRHIKANRS